MFKNDNKMSIIQSLIVHDSIGKRKIVLDQIREGLQTLGFGSRMSANPDIFEELFVPCNNISSESVKQILTFPTNLRESEESVREYTLHYIESVATSKDLKDFLIFATGAPCLPEYGLGKIKIEFSNDTSIFSSICLNKITFPQEFPDRETFIGAIRAVCDNAGKAFTSV